MARCEYLPGLPVERGAGQVGRQTASESRLSLTSGSSSRQGLLDGGISRFAVECRIERQRRAESLVEPRNPGMLVGEAPSLDRRAARVLQTDRNNISINLRLRG